MIEIRTFHCYQVSFQYAVYPQVRNPSVHSDIYTLMHVV